MDEEELSEKESNVELPVQVDTHFKKFNIKFRKAESKEEVLKASYFNFGKRSFAFESNPNRIQR